MPRSYDPTPPWVTYEVLKRDSQGRLVASGERPFSESLADGGDCLASAIGKMWLVGAHGWPEAKRVLRDDKGRPLINRADDKDPAIWILKCKPSCWRLYFHVYPNQNQGERRILYLHAKCKKKDRRDEEDARHARTVFESVRPGGSGIIRFEFPSG